MTRDEMILCPTHAGSVRLLAPIDSDSLITSLQPYLDQQLSGKKQIGLRTAEGWDGTGDLRDSGRKINLELLESFNSWVQGTEVLQSIATALGIREYGRVRMLNLSPRSTYSFHQDIDGWRVHIPLKTNDSAFVVVDGRLWHLPIGNAYLVKVKDYHCAMNAGTEDRIHIVFDLCDNLAEDDQRTVLLNNKLKWVKQ